MERANKELSKPLLMLSSIVPPVGFVLYFVHRKTSPKKARKAMGSALIGIPIGFVMGNYIMPFLFNLLF